MKLTKKIPEPLNPGKIRRHNIKKYGPLYYNVFHSFEVEKLLQSVSLQTPLMTLLNKGDYNSQTFSLDAECGPSRLDKYCMTTKSTMILKWPNNVIPSERIFKL